MKTKNNLLLIISLIIVNFTYSQTNIFPDDGNVGIGTVTPTAKTDIILPEEATMESGLRITSPFTFLAGSNINTLFHLRKSGFNQGSYFSQFVVRTNGRVGIGEENPNSKLHVHNGRIQITGNNSYGGPMMVFGGDVNAPNGQWGIEYVSNGVSGLNFWKPDGSTNGNNGDGFGNHFLFLADNGKVSIGLDPNNPNSFPRATLSGDYNLYVGRGILTEKARVAVRSSDDWADYVFKDDYHLLTLSQVEKHIQEKGHLPNVPSAEEIVNSGIDVAKMDAKLMEKIEELTLYVIQLKKENEEIKALLKNKNIK
ncbi:hypothetical protein [Kordia sp.]|uniref:hypothetical protein n=1 Tax=Kordia sp. TaxID=1965332 RepID=UPI0025BDD4E6|nr:hypothetical protein [Kordia sp.]MCH2194747.1 hypothetical protein [Kordia sp.]